jgi:DNA-binding GntR family transcriptional regulator
LKILLWRAASHWRAPAATLPVVPVNPNDPKAPYLQIADELRRAIQTGELAPGERLESGRKLAQQYGVAPMTVQQAIRELRNEGLVVTWQGRGAYVRGGQAHERSGDTDIDAITGRLESMADALQALEARVARLEKAARTAPRRRSDG